MPRILSRTLCITLLALAWPAALLAQDAPPATPAPADPHARGSKEITADIEKVLPELAANVRPDMLTDPAKRKEAAPKVLPLLTKVKGYTTELKKTDDQGKMIAEQLEPQVLSLLVAFDDQATKDELNKTSEGSDKSAAVSARGILLSGQWVAASKDEDAQKKLLEQATKLTKENPKSEELTRQLAQMSQLGPATAAMRDQVTDLIGTMQTQTGAMMKERLASAAKLRAMENKPLEIAGVLNDGKQFSTANWKGKVILVDFWATWCGPCREELPRVKKAYADWHAKGLEVLGVSCDNDGDDLSKFLSANKDMPWPQLFDAKNPGWHPLAKSYGIDGIPTMFLIDKKGVVRTVEARENFEELIPKMLNE
jgi:thiol-disulfide isomerase/thioredoxin